MNAQKIFFIKYLKILGIEASKPSLELLEKIVKAHLIKIPFENISKLLFKKEGMKHIPDLQTYLTGIEKYHFGGTCYSNNYYLYLLLKYLGFEIKLCGADMKNPDVHLISMVKIDEQEYMIDAGYAAPFLMPLPRDLSEDYIITSGREKYIIKPKDENGRTKVECVNDELQHWYTAKPHPRKFDEFCKVIEDSYSNDAAFMNALRITRFSENGSLVLKNYMFTETKGIESSILEIPPHNISALIQEKFGMPENLVREAVVSLKELKDIYN